MMSKLEYQAGKRVPVTEAVTELQGYIIQLSEELIDAQKRLAQLEKFMESIVSRPDFRSWFEQRGT